jgi:hypothetical protein
MGDPEPTDIAVARNGRAQARKGRPLLSSRAFTACMADGWRCPRQRGRPWTFGALSASFNAARYRAATPGKPFQVAVQRGVRMYHDQTTRPLNDMRWEMLTLLAHGAFVTMIDKTAYDGWLDPVAYDRIGELLGEAPAMRDQSGQFDRMRASKMRRARSRRWRKNPFPIRYVMFGYCS